MTLSDSENREMVSIAAAMDADEPAAMFPSQLAPRQAPVFGQPGDGAPCGCGGRPSAWAP